MVFDKKEIIIAIIRWLTTSGQEQSLKDFVFQLENDFTRDGQQINKRQLKLLVSYTSFELATHNIVQYDITDVSPKKPIDPTISKMIADILIQDEQLESSNLIVRPENEKPFEDNTEYPTRLVSFLEKNSININDLFQLSLEEIKKVPNFGKDTINFITYFMKKNGQEFSNTTKIHDLVKDPYNSLLSSKSKRLVDELSSQEVQKIISLGPEGMLELSGYNHIGKKTSREIYDYLYSSVLADTSNQQGDLVHDKTKLLTLSELSKDELELILSPLEFLDLKPRVKSGLKSLGIKYLGEMAAIDRSKFLGLPNAGSTSWHDIFSIVQKYELLPYANIEWPAQEFIEGIVSQLNLDVGRPLAVSSLAARTIEEEAKDIFAQVLSPNQFKVLTERIGLGEDELGMTLQELAEAEVVSNKVVSRERIRQIEAKALRAIRKRKLYAENLQKGIKSISSHSIILKSDAVNKLHGEGFSKHEDPVKLIQRLCDAGFGIFNFKDIHMPFIGETLLFNQHRFAPRDLKKFFGEIKRSVVGNAFACIPISKLDNFDNKTGELETSLSLSRNLVCIRFNENLYIAKKPKRLVTKNNKIVTSLVKIFGVSRSCSIRDLYEGVKKTKNLRDEFPLEVFFEFVKRLDFLELKESLVFCLSPPKVNSLTKGEKVIVNLAKEAGSILDSDMLQRTLIQHGLSSGIARQTVMHTPLLINIKKGHYRQKGLYKFVGNLDEPLVESNLEQSTLNDISIQIKLEPKIRMLGRVSITEKLPKEGDFDVYDKDENFLCVLRYQGVTLSGLRPLLIDIDAQLLSLKFEVNSDSFVVE